MKSRGKEFETIFHLIYLSVLTVFGILLAVVGTIAGGEDVIVVIEIAMIMFVWIAHIFQVGSSNQRIYFYTIAATLLLMYYGSHEDSITDMPLVLCLMLIVLSVQEDMGLIYLISVSYPLMVLHHIFVTGYINLDMNWIILSRIVLGIICVLIAVVLSRFFIHSNEAKRKKTIQLEKELADSKKEGRNLLANVSHELRTPINAISGISEMILNENIDESIRSQVKDIHIAGHRIYRQVTGLLDYSEIITDRVVVEPHAYDVSEVVDACLHDLMEENNPKNLSIEAHIDDSVPKILVGDEAKIYRVILSLLENSYKFTNEGSIKLEVSARKEHYGVNLNFDITDTGAGIPQELVDRMYLGNLRDNENNGSNRMAGGIGIGFFVACELIKQQNGFVLIDSKVGEGTHVRVCVPQTLSEEGDVADITAQAEKSAESEPLRVLVVDDEPMNLKVVRGMLRTFGIEAKIAENGSEGLALCELEDYDLIFMDYMMPEMDGEETMYRIRGVRNGFYQNVPIVALTANAASGARQMFLDMGFDEFVSKPVVTSDMEKLLKQLQSENRIEKFGGAS